MKAVVYEKYGTPDVMHMKDVKPPVPKDTEVLVKLYATSLNASDWEFLTCDPLYVRLWGLFKPKFPILGSDIAGQVVAVGKNITEFKPGDEVFGDIFMQRGGFAEYVCATQDQILLKPSHMSFEQAAALPQASTVALQALRDKGQIKPGQKVMINGAGGGSGSFAIQLAKYFGAEVTGVDNGEKQQVMRALGADHVIDYTKEDLTRHGQSYDLIIDLMAQRSIFDYRPMLKPGGRYVLVGGRMGRILQLLFLGPLFSFFTGKKAGILGHQQNKKDLCLMIKLFETGEVMPEIDRCFSLPDVPKALGYLGQGHAKGKVIILNNES